VNPQHTDGSTNTISRKHVAIDRRSDGSYAFTDLGAMNGSFLNDRKTLQATLEHGDTLQLGGGAGIPEGHKLQSRDAGICYTFFVYGAPSPRLSSKASPPPVPSPAKPLLISSGSTKRPAPANAAASDTAPAASSLPHSSSGLQKASPSDGGGKRHKTSVPPEKSPSKPLGSDRASPAVLVSPKAAPVRAATVKRISLQQFKKAAAVAAAAQAEFEALATHASARANAVNDALPLEDHQELNNREGRRGASSSSFSSAASLRESHAEKHKHSEAIDAAAAASSATTPAGSKRRSSSGVDASVQAEAFKPTTTTATTTVHAQVQTTVSGPVVAERGSGLLATISAGAADVVAKELKCGYCGDLLLEARLLPCSHGYCRLCFHDAFVATDTPPMSSPEGAGTAGDAAVAAAPSSAPSVAAKDAQHKVEQSAGEATSTPTATTTPSRRRRCCAVCRGPVPPGFKALASMHLENLVDLVVESLGGELQLQFATRRSEAKARLAQECTLMGGDDAAAAAVMESIVPDLVQSIEKTLEAPLQQQQAHVLAPEATNSTTATNGRATAIKTSHQQRNFGRSGTPPPEYDSEAEDNDKAKGNGNDGEESGDDDDARGPRCESCSERGHHVDECPHRDSSEDENNEDEEEETDNGGDSGEDY